MSRLACLGLVSRKVNTLLIWAALPFVICIGVFLSHESYASFLRLTNDVHQDLYPEWSPDGTQIAFASDRSGNFDIWVINADGTGLTQLTDSPLDENYPSWSGDGSQIAYTKHDPNAGVFGGDYLCKMAADGTGQTELQLPAAVPQEDPPQYTPYWEFDIKLPVWSPDDSKLAFVSYGPEGGAFKIYTYDLQSGIVAEVTPSAEENPFGEIYRVSWDQETRMIYDRYPIGLQTFDPTTAADYGIFIPAPAGHEGMPVEPAWNSDGSKLVYAKGMFYETGNTLAILSQSTGLITSLEALVTNASWPSWSPDGTRLAFVHDRIGNSDIGITTLPRLPDASPLTGTYVVYEFESGFHGGDVGAWGANDEQFLVKTEITFDGAGNFTADLDDYRQNRLIGQADIHIGSAEDQDTLLSNTFTTTTSLESGPESGTYTVSSDGTVLLTFTDEEETETIAGTISEDGKMILFSFSEFEDANQYSSMGIGVGVKKGSGMTNASLDGSYAIREFESGFHGGDAGAWGANDEHFLVETEIVFDGAGSFTADLKDYGQNRWIFEEDSSQGTAQDQDTLRSNRFTTTNTFESGPESGTYTVYSDGTVELTLTEDGETETITGILSEDGKTILLGFSDFDDTNRYCSMGIGVGAKKGSGFTNASLSGLYTVGEFEAGFHGGDAGAWGANDEQFLVKTEITFDGAGNFTANLEDEGQNRWIYETDIDRSSAEDQDWVRSNRFSTTSSYDSGPESGTYTVSSDGTVQLTVTDEEETETITGILSEDGKTILLGFTEFDDVNRHCSMGIGVGVKRGGFSLLEKGNVNGDEIVDMQDAILVLQVQSGLPVPAIYLGADVDGDGKIGWAEEIYILQKVADSR